MRVSRGESLHAKRRSKTRVCPLAQEGQSVFVLVRRFDCKEGELNRVKERIKSGLDTLSATWLSSCPTDNGKGWEDTYRIALGGRTVQEITRLCRFHHIYDGPYAGSGRVCAGLAREDGSVSSFCGPAGTGPDTRRKKNASIVRALYQEVVKSEPLPLELMVRLGLAWRDVPQAGLALAVDSITGKIAPPPGDELFTAEEWSKLSDRWIGWVNVYYYVFRTYQSSGDSSRLDILTDWGSIQCGQSKLQLEGIEKRHYLKPGGFSVLLPVSETPCVVPPVALPDPFASAVECDYASRLRDGDIAPAESIIPSPTITLPTRLRLPADCPERWIW